MQSVYLSICQCNAKFFLKRDASEFSKTTSEEDPSPDYTVRIEALVQTTCHNVAPGYSGQLHTHNVIWYSSHWGSSRVSACTWLYRANVLWDCWLTLLCKKGKVSEDRFNSTFSDVTQVPIPPGKGKAPNKTYDPVKWRRTMPMKNMNNYQL